MTKKSQVYRLKIKEKRDSRLKETRNLIISKSFSSLMNNQKWYEVFDWIEQHNFQFELKTLLSTEIKKSNQVFELEKSSILIDESGNFIEFFELDQLILKNATELKTELEKMNVEFIEHVNFVEISGYRK